MLDRVLADGAERPAGDHVCERRRIDERRPFGPELVEVREKRCRQGRPPRLVGRVPDNAEDPARAEHARDLADRFVVREPVERLAGEDGVDRRVGKRNRLRRPGERLDTRHNVLENTAHPVERLDRDDARVPAREHAGELSGPGPEVEDRRAGRDRHTVENLGRVRRAARLVGLGAPVEAARGFDRQRTRVYARAA